MHWNEWYLQLAQVAASKSKDPSTKVGAVIVRPDNTIAAVGYNGFPRGMDDGPDRYANRDEKYSRVIHAEMNALLACKEPVEGYTCYTTMPPCERCAVHLIQAGISNFIFYKLPEGYERWNEATDKAKSYIRECRCSYREV